MLIVIIGFMEHSFYQETFRVRSFHIDYFGQLRMGALFNFLTECAGIHAAQLEVGYNQLQPLDLFWVLSRIKLQIRQIPKWHDRVTVKTWPKGFYKLFALRDFFVMNEQSEILAAVTSSWLLIDKKSLRPQRHDRLPNVISFNPENQAIPERLEKLNAPETLISHQSRQVMFSELDVNHHLNNSRYVEWIMDGLGLEWHQRHRLRSFQLNFTEEVKPGQIIELRRFESGSGENEMYIDGVKSPGTMAFQAAIGFDHL